MRPKEEEEESILSPQPIIIPPFFQHIIRDPLEYVGNNTTATATVVAMKKVLKTL